MATNRSNKNETKPDPKKGTLADVRTLAKILRQHDLSEVEVETEEARIRVSRSGSGGPVVAVAPAPQPQVAAPAAPGESKGNGVSDAVDDSLVTINSPFVGTFYQAPSPGAAPFAKSGQAVTKGHTLCIVEAMKLMNEIEAEMDCTVVEVLAKDAETVEYGQPLFRVLPA